MAIKNNDLIRQRALAGLSSMFLGDALAMPVHWFYDPRHIDEAFPGGIKQLEDAPGFHPSSIMALHSTSKGGRGVQETIPKQLEIVGDVILKGKRRFWGQPNLHYHHGMKAGDNTLNAHCARLLMRSIVTNEGRYNCERFLDEYIAFMTSNVPRHPDTYAESYHRAFFANLVAGRPRNQSGGVTHDTPSIGGLVSIAPIVIAERIAGTSLDEVQALCREHLYLTHPDEYLAAICTAYVTMLDALLFRPDEQNPREILAEAARSTLRLNLEALVNRSRNDREVVGGRYSTACYITDSWPSVLYLAYRYLDEPKKCLLANANLGGDNVHRGIVLGMITGLSSDDFPQDIYQHLTDHKAIDSEIRDLLDLADKA
jgi:ADP-ribosylglycohydrolase